MKVKLLLAFNILLMSVFVTAIAAAILLTVSSFLHLFSFYFNSESSFSDSIRIMSSHLMAGHVTAARTLNRPRKL